MNILLGDSSDEQHFRLWLPRDILSRTNWLYRVDALCPHNRRELAYIWELVVIYRAYATQFLLWAYSLTSAARRCTDIGSLINYRRL